MSTGTSFSSGSGSSSGRLSAAIATTASFVGEERRPAYSSPASCGVAGGTATTLTSFVAAAEERAKCPFRPQTTPYEFRSPRSPASYASPLRSDTPAGAVRHAREQMVAERKTRRDQHDSVIADERRLLASLTKLQTSSSEQDAALFDGGRALESFSVLQDLRDSGRARPVGGDPLDLDRVITPAQEAALLARIATPRSGAGGSRAVTPRSFATLSDESSSAENRVPAPTLKAAEVQHLVDRLYNPRALDERIADAVSKHSEPSTPRRSISRDRAAAAADRLARPFLRGDAMADKLGIRRMGEPASVRAPSPARAAVASPYTPRRAGSAARIDAESTGAGAGSARPTPRDERPSPMRQLQMQEVAGAPARAASPAPSSPARVQFAQVPSSPRASASPYLAKSASPRRAAPDAAAVPAYVGFARRVNSLLGSRA